MRIKALQSFAGAGGAFAKGIVYDVVDDLASDYVRSGLAEKVEEDDNPTPLPLPVKQKMKKQPAPQLEE